MIRAGQLPGPEMSIGKLSLTLRSLASNQSEKSPTDAITEDAQQQATFTLTAKSASCCLSPEPPPRVSPYCAAAPERPVN